MCGNCNDPFHGLTDDLDDALDAQTGAPVDATLADAQQYKMHEEKCPSCRGSGRFVSYTGRVVGNCFKCKGKGVVFYRQSTEKRQQQAQYRANKKRRDAEEVRERAYLWACDNAEDAAWIAAKAGSFDFATAMAEALDKYGQLTERQHATVTHLRLADEERARTRAAEKALREANAPVIDLAKIEEAFSTAQANGIKRPKLRLDTFKFSLAPASGRNAGAIYVVDADSDQYLGKIAGAKFHRVRECSNDQEQRIVAVAADPRAAAIAYGMRTGNCCICGRELTNAESVELGIGPICAGRMGW